jgi:hypothetical protein
MTLRAQSSELRAARTILQALADDTAVADGYKSDHMRISGGDTGALFQHIDNVNRDVVERLDDVLSRLRSVLHESGAELATVATYYDDADEAARQRADQQIPLVADVPAGGGFDDRAEVPDTVPTDPGDYEPPEGHPGPTGDDDGMIMAPGPLGEPGQPSTGTGALA